MRSSVFVAQIVSAYPTKCADPSFFVPLGQRQLFLDDHGISQIESLKRPLHQPKKKGAVIRSPDPNETIQTRSAPQWVPNEKLFKLWVVGTKENVWQSPNGLHWTPAPKSDTAGLVVYDASEPDPQRCYKAALLNHGFAVSSDGVEWTKLDIPVISSGDEGNFSYDLQEGRFIHTVKRGGPYGRSVAIAVSHDFQNWDDYGLVFHADA